MNKNKIDAICNTVNVIPVLKLENQVQTAGDWAGAYQWWFDGFRSDTTQ